MSATLIRAATLDDAAACGAVLCDSLTTLCVPDHQNNERVLSRWVSNKTPEHMLRWIQDPATEIYVAERADEIVAVGGILKRGEITLNYVSPRARFMGVSRQLLAHMEQALRSGGVTTARLTSTETAHRFYLAAGWRDVGEPQIWIGLTGFPMDKSL